MIQFDIAYECEKCGAYNEFEPNSNFDFDLANEHKAKDDYSYDECSECGALHEVQLTLSYRREHKEYEMDEFESILLEFKFCKETAKTLDTWVEHRKPFKDGNQLVDLLCDMFVFYLRKAYDGTIWQFDKYADAFGEVILKLGYDPHACMVEKLKEIASFKLDNGQAGFFSYEDAKNALVYHNSCYYAIDEYDDHFYAHALPQSGCVFPKWYRANYQNATNGERSERDFTELVSNIEGEDCNDSN